MAALAWIVLFLLVIGTLAYCRSRLWVWTLSIGAYLLLVSFFSNLGAVSLTILWLLFAVVAIPLNILPLRRLLLTKTILNIYRKVLPTMSRTEKEALEAGTVGWEGELFSGKPNWQKFMSYPANHLSSEEQAFLDGPVEELCRMTDNWDITHNRADLPPEIWQFLKDNGFWGFIIPKRYGGREFSALAHAEVISKLASRSISVATTVAVPNSLGPAELLLHYGTEEQKNYYLPRLAKGDEIPCFALTGPEAGSDAGAMPDYGIVCHGKYQGKDTVGIRISWDKRYITLAPVATVLGLAFKLYDPNHILGDKEDIGITCALIPTDTPGVKIGRRHFPVNSAFMNGPTTGQDVFIPIEWIIGGQKMAGQGWRMLVECLSAGRAISLPSTVGGGAKLATFATGAYARIRRQFGLPVGRFEGIEEVIARMGGFTYIGEATRLMTIAVVDRGEKPAVLSAISKYHCTELGRKITNDAMDIHGGKGIQLGPRNYLGRGYEETPIAITVEGANILTRSMIIFGQGAIRCHPYVYSEMTAAKLPDRKQGLIDFDRAFFGHLGFTISNKVRSFVLGITGSRFARTPVANNKRYYQLVTRFSAAFALVADMAMFLLGGELKRREKLSARLGDVLSMLYMTTAVLKRFEEQGRPQEDQPIIDWSCQYLLYQAQHQLNNILRNFPNRLLGGLLRICIFPLGLTLKEPKDQLGHQVANLFISPTQARQRLATAIYITPDKNNPVGQMELTLQKVLATEEVWKRVYHARHEGVIKGYTFDERLKSAVTLGVLTQDEADHLLEARKGRLEVYAVDDFTTAELAHGAAIPAKSEEKATE